MKKCKYCRRGTMYLKESKYGKFWACNRFPKCAGKEPFKEEKSDLEKQADEFLKKNLIN